MKSVERVRDLGEVFTPTETVAAMLDLLPDEVWQPHPARTFLEPAAGNGNFLVAILERKLAAVAVAWQDGSLPAGCDVDALELHGLEALSSLYGVDISAENIIGGLPGHEVGARDRMLDVFRTWFGQVTSQQLSARSQLLAAASWIVERNVLVANMLPLNADGTPSGRDELPLVEYGWTPASGRVEITLTTLGQVESEARVRGTGEMTLFDGLAQPSVIWVGRPRDLRDAPVEPPSDFAGPARNGTRRR